MSAFENAGSWRRFGLGTLAVAALVGLIYIASRPEAVPVDLAEVTRGPLEVTINAEGQTRIRDIYDLSAPVTGQLSRSPVRVGDTVVAGKTLVARIAPGAPAFLDDRARAQAEAAVAQAKAALKLAQSETAKAEADLGHAQVNLSRLVDLFARGTAAQAQLDQAELDLDLAVAKLDAAHAQHEMRKGELAAKLATLIEPGRRGTADDNPACCVDLLAPVSGTVLSVAHESARMVPAGTAILSIGETRDLEIVADLLSSDAVRLSAGARAYVERWGGSDVLMAHLRVVEPSGFTKLSALGIEEQRVKVLLNFDSPTEARAALGHGFRAYLRIVEWASPDVLLVPISALFRQGGQWATYRLEGAAAVLRQVEIGHRNDAFAEVVAGLSSGDRVITHPGERVGRGAGHGSGCTCGGCKAPLTGLDGIRQGRHIRSDGVAAPEIAPLGDGFGHTVKWRCSKTVTGPQVRWTGPEINCPERRGIDWPGMNIPKPIPATDMEMHMQRPQFFVCENGEKAPLPFSNAEYERRLTQLRAIMAAKGIEAALFTSMHNIAYYSGFLYCAFGRPYGCVVTADRCTTISANIDAGQPWRRSFGDNVIYTDWERNNYWRAVREVAGGANHVGIEGDHLTLAQQALAKEFLNGAELVDIAGDTMQARMIKSAEEIVLIKEGARVADVGGQPSAMRSVLAPARLISPWPGGMRWKRKSPVRILTAKSVTAGSGSNRGSTPTVPTIR